MTASCVRPEVLLYTKKGEGRRKCKVQSILSALNVAQSRLIALSYERCIVSTKINRYNERTDDLMLPLVFSPPPLTPTLGLAPPAVECIRPENGSSAAAVAHREKPDRLSSCWTETGQGHSENEI
ncbi:Hypothetical predicted protein [Scomber scombrus]|uniref:Uncharacterized protein n=1 Tax=Scomber scombrus TaxID=13677 RepID=A0AAV1NVQ2_SCOSC